MNRFGSHRLLAVDVGNTSTAFGLWDAGVLHGVRHVDGSVSDVMDALAESRLSVGAEAVAFASVVPSKNAAFRRGFRQLGFDLIPVNLESFHRAFALHGLRLDYPQPEEIGADRLADAAGAVVRYGAPTLIMDFGTAFTAAVVSSDRIWRGGVIAPGLPLVASYFCDRTALLPRLDLTASRIPRIGRSTEEAMRFGALVGYRGMVREIVAELKRNFPEDFRLVATGGFAERAVRGLDQPVTVDADLTLFGTGLIAASILPTPRQYPS